MSTFRKTDNGYAVDTAGHPKDILLIELGPSSCGDIRDGISFAHALVDNPKTWDDGEGCWLISFVDLEAIYLAAKARHEHTEGIKAKELAVEMFGPGRAP